MTLLQPIWLILIPALLLIGVVVKQLHLFRPVRLTIVIFMALLLAQPTIRLRDQTLDLWVLVDRSASTQDRVDQGYAEWKKILEREKPSRNDRLHFIDYAAEVIPQDASTAGSAFTANRKLTKTKLAIDNVIARLDDQRPSRILLFTDGFSTEPLHEVGDKLARAEVPLDYRLVTERQFGDFQIVNLELPSQIQVNEPFIIRIEVEGDFDGPVPLSIYRDDNQLKDTEVVIKDGKGKLEFTTRLAKAGSYAFKTMISPLKDSFEGNNTSEKWIKVMGGPKVLLVSNYVNDPLLKVLAQQNYRVDLVSDSTTLRPQHLVGAESVIFNNVPAHEVPTDFLSALPFYVEEQGGGFLMVGGNRSFASGGYFKSAIDEMMPITMELKNDHRKLSVAMSIVMDRSGSMMAAVSDPSGGSTTKMQLANNGAAEAIGLLGQEDQISIHMVDTKATLVIKLQSIQGKQKQLQKKAMSIVSGGGGIHVYEGLNEGWLELRKSPFSTKHMILFSDAADSVRPGKYKELISRMVEQGASISVIAMGQKSDSDAKLLEDIAKRGKGRIFYANDALDIPKLFAQETVTIARSAFLDQPIQTIPTGQWQDISRSPLDWLSRVDGYNLSYARPKAVVSLVSQDEYKAPLVAHWQRGAGRVATISFPLGGDHSQSARGWAGYGDMTQTLIRWLNGDPLPPGLTMRNKLQGTDLKLDLFYDTEESDGSWPKIFAKSAPRIMLQRNQDDPTSLHWKRIAPGHYSLNQNLQEGDIIKGAIQAGNYAFPFGPILVDGNTEWKFISERVAELKSLSTQSGGRELIDLSKAWERPVAVRQRFLLIPLAIFLLALIILDAYLSQTGKPLRSVLSIFTPTKTTEKDQDQPTHKKLKRSKKTKPSKRKKSTPEKQPTKPTTNTQPNTQPNISRADISRADISRADISRADISRADRFAKAKKRK